jgi:hypothetical protein
MASHPRPHDKSDDTRKGAYLARQLSLSRNYQLVICVIACLGSNGGAKVGTRGLGVCRLLLCADEQRSSKILP